MAGSGNAAPISGDPGLRESTAKVPLGSLGHGGDGREKTRSACFGKSWNTEGSPPRHLLLLLDATAVPAGGTNPVSKHLHARQDRGGVFPSPVCKGGAEVRQGGSPSSRGEDAAGSGMKLSGCFPINLLLSPTWLATSFPWWPWDAWVVAGPPQCIHQKEVAPREGGSAAVGSPWAGWRRATSLARQTDPSTSRVTKAPKPPSWCAARCYRVDSTHREELLWEVWISSSCPSLLSHPATPSPLPTASLPPPASCAVGKQTAPGKHAGLNFHLGTV